MDFKNCQKPFILTDVFIVPRMGVNRDIKKCIFDPHLCFFLYVYENAFVPKGFYAATTENAVVVTSSPSYIYTVCMMRQRIITWFTI